MSDRALFLDVAHRIGQRIARQATWDEQMCTWTVMTPDRNRSGRRQATPTIAGGAIYQGTAGIALFLGELYRHTDDAEILRVAEGALRHALTEAKQLAEHRFGFHSGRVGIAYAAARMARRFQRDDYLHEAAQILAPLHGQEDQDRGLDVIGGAAGAIPALLQLAGVLDQNQMHAMAVALGNHLIHAAHKEPTGWSWGSTRPTSVRHLLGLAHGASGIAHALLELYGTTGKRRYRYAAEQAMCYERQFFDEENSNWPDFRYTELSEYLYYGQQDELIRRVKAGDLPPYKRKFMSAWCHGAPGIGLVRLRAYEMLQQYEHEAQQAAQATLASLKQAGSNFSLCHGLGGNCETLLYAADQLSAPELRSHAEACGRQGWDLFERAGRPWPCGTSGGASDPSLMLGEAGIGYFYLRLVSSETPSVLLLRAPDAVAQPSVSDEGLQTIRDDYVRTYFSRTLRVIETLYGQTVSASAGSPPPTPQRETDVERTYQAIRERIATAEEPQRVLLEDAARPERLRYELSLEVTDFTQEFIDSLRRPRVEDAAWTTATFQLAPCTRVTATGWDWEAWLREEANGAVPPEPSDVFYVLYRRENRIHEQRLSPFAFLVLEGLDAPARLDDVVARMQESCTGVDHSLLRRKVTEQLKHAYQIGLLVCQPSTALETMNVS